jgi:hypothetical protein
MVKGVYSDAVIYSDAVEEGALGHIQAVCDSPLS